MLYVFYFFFWLFGSGIGVDLVFVCVVLMLNFYLDIEYYIIEIIWGGCVMG